MRTLTMDELDELDAFDVIRPTDGHDIAILDEECEHAEHILTPERARRWAARLLSLADEVAPREPRPLQRIRAVDDLVREVDER